MSDAEFSFDAAAWEKTVNEIRGRWDDIKSRKEFGGIVSATVFQDIMEHFAKQEGPGGKWPAWSTSYMDAIQGRAAFRFINGRLVRLNEYQVEEYGIKPPRKMGLMLQATGNLRKSFTPTSWLGNDAGILFYNRAKTRTGFAYAEAHDQGTEKLPQRNFMWLSTKAMGNILTRKIKWLSEGKERGSESVEG
jgi:hypothetical protein